MECFTISPCSPPDQTTQMNMSLQWSRAHKYRADVGWDEIYFGQPPEKTCYYSAKYYSLIYKIILDSLAYNLLINKLGDNKHMHGKQKADEHEEDKGKHRIKRWGWCWHG